MRHLIRVDVERLLGRFDHTINFPADWDFAILHGPNGVGKTKLLQLITYALAPNIVALKQIPFDTATFTFDDNNVLTLRRSPADASTSEADVPAREDETRSTHVVYILDGPDGESSTWDTDDLSTEQWSRAARFIEREAPVRQVGPSTWRDLRTGERMRVQEVVERYPFALPPSLFRNLTAGEMPARMRDFCESMNIHLIETQRLTTRDSTADARRPDRDAAQRPTVEMYAEDLSTRLHQALANNSRASQLLDRSFPKRVLEAHVPAGVDDNTIRERYEQQSQLRTRLTQIALLEDRTDLPLPDRRLQKWERGVLWTYLDDTDAKLSTFDSLLQRVDVLREIIGARFLYKHLVIDTELGFRIVTDEGVEVPPSSLSSGEQHELILIYDLLFNAAPDSLVLIDEPEISLHVAWQQRFLTDMARISEVASLRFIVATHSPQIIHKWWSRTVRLTPDHDDADTFARDAANE